MTKRLQWVNRRVSHLHEDSEEDLSDGGGDEELLQREVIHEEHQREADCSPQATVGYDELVPEGYMVVPHPVDAGRQDENT